MRLFFRLLFIGGHPIGFSGQRLLPTSTVSDLKQTVRPGGLFGTICRIFFPTSSSRFDN
jgi:hypothetical protein